MPAVPRGITVEAEPHDSADAQALQEALSARLKARYGSDGKAGFAGFTGTTGYGPYATRPECACLAKPLG